MAADEAAQRFDATVREMGAFQDLKKIFSSTDGMHAQNEVRKLQWLPRGPDYVEHYALLRAVGSSHAEAMAGTILHFNIIWGH